MLRSMTLLLFLAAAVTKDMQTYKIPNALLATGAANGCFLRFIAEGWPGILDGTAGAVLPLVLCMGLFIFSMIGAGDVKLMMAVGVYVGAGSILRVMLYACGIGAGFALIKVLAYGLAGGRKAYFLDYFRKIVQEGKIRPYIDMDRLADEKLWLMHFSVPVFLAVLYELL